jgi:hypothetical protein
MMRERKALMMSMLIVTVMSIAIHVLEVVEGETVGDGEPV